MLGLDTSGRSYAISYKKDDFCEPTPVSILYKSIAGRYRPVKVYVADGPITAHYRFIKNDCWDCSAINFVLRFKG